MNDGMAEHVARVVAEWPPLSPEQRDRVIDILSVAGVHGADRPGADQQGKGQEGQLDGVEHIQT